MLASTAAVNAQQSGGLLAGLSGLLEGEKNLTTFLSYVKVCAWLCEEGGR